MPPSSLPGTPMMYWLVMAVLIVMSMVFLMLTHQSDPGIIPPKVMKDPMIIAVRPPRSPPWQN